MKELDENRAGKALAGVLGGFYLLCAVAFTVVRNSTLELGQNLFHGLVLNMRPLEPAGVLVGLVGWVAIGYVGGHGFAGLYNRS